MAVMVTSLSIGFSLVILVSRLLARMSRPMSRRISVHSSCCSASTAPTRRTGAVRSGKMPTDVGAAADLAVQSFLVGST
jgi:hypothetical protein